MPILPDLHSVTALTAVAVSFLAWVLFTASLYLHRWLSSLAGHPIGPAPTVKHLP